MAGRKNSFVERSCEACSTTFHIRASVVAKGRGRFCSKGCFDQSRRIGRIDRTCEVCDTHFQVYPSIVAKGRARFCSKDCQKRWQTVPLIERFYRYVGPVTETGCILWTGAVSIGGYGVISSGTQNGTNIYANRLSYELFIGPIPEGLFVLHRCDRPCCISPFHFFLGTTMDNIADKVRKGRQPKGESHGFAKLTDELVRAIRDRYSQGDISQEHLAWEHRVSHRTIGNIVNRRTWTHV